MERGRVRSNEQLQDHALLATIETTLAPLLFARKLAHDTVRVWILGCGTGEVAYLVTGVLYAYARQRADPPSIQIFATDSDEGAITTARRGQYPERLASTIPPEWLRYFLHNEQHYQAPEIVRNLITFAQHQLLRDPP